ncbi:MAG: FHA domain-containing protein [Terriglobia bacterium]
MAQLYLKFEDTVLKKIALSGGIVTIGRLPDNLVHLDNPGVSGHHARVYWENERYVVEDLNSTNGTYLNSQPIRKADLKDGYVIAVGKHTLEFKAHSAEESRGAGAVVDRASHWQKRLDEKPLLKLDPTALMDMDRAQEILAAAGQSPREAPAATPRRGKVGVLRVIEGKADAQRYTLSSKMNVIGKSATASIRLRGWFAPETAAIIDRRENGYFVGPAAKDVMVRVNGELISETRELQEGDALEVAGLKMTFGYQ